MSVRIPLDDAPASRARRGDDKTFVARRVALTLTGAVLLVGLAAVPLPARQAALDAETRLLDMSARVDHDHTELARLREHQTGLDAERGLDSADLLRWIEPVDPLELRNAVLTSARAVGLRLARIDVEGSEQDARPPAAQGERRVLGVDPDGDAEAGLDGEPDGDSASAGAPGVAPTAGLRLDLRGQGSLAQVLVFAALLRELPAPLRLTHLEFDTSPGSTRFELGAVRLTADHLRSGTAPP